jgi:hypothetical protein
MHFLCFTQELSHWLRSNWTRDGDIKELRSVPAAVPLAATVTSDTDHTADTVSTKV